MPETIPTAKTVLTSSFWTLLGARFSAFEHSNVGVVIDDSADYLANYTEITYGDLPFWDTLAEKTQLEIVYMAYLVIGEPFAKVFDAMSAEYDPLENYFTNRTYNEHGSGSNEKNGSIDTTPSGSTSTKTSGKRERSYTDHGSKHLGTTYDKNGDNDFANISKDETNGTITDDFTNYGTTTDFTNYKIEQKYNKVTDTASNSKSGGEKRSGSSGIFSKQDLTQREVDLRLRNMVAPILVRMVVDVFNTGVWRP